MGSVVKLFLNGWFSRFRTRPDFELAPGLREFKAVPTTFQPNRRGANSYYRCSTSQHKNKSSSYFAYKNYKQ